MSFYNYKSRIRPTWGDRARDSGGG